ncbi:rna-directed dna polymerase from mobile element jockey-like [Limosa lapponica baueri]|uniref:Rna-directed dna polymerase from mobile element jockey-like n=1 Tax=Limosa lapponica baueri TaxID=1758121 RepID=A0A2I0URQ8_LIMLA|nr:rna-directed dna polymerase from mobile element jockey-like [Limosa lapponica baueri]
MRGTLIKFADDTHQTLIKFADDTKLGGEVDTSEGRTILQTDMDSLEEWASKNSMNLNKAKYKVLHLGQNNQRVQCRLRFVWLGSSLAERDLGVLVSNKQCCILGCIHRDIMSR